ncbi:flagellar hook-basal body protein [Paenibacillus agilis]|uniref:Flagellar hook-basal body protein n=1 Tax=Paenibacillus agilis TaxID=3020863 RepID=A0A559IPE1_9BACL|nr:flagellar hook-basal body protein [Paenibacillus agilis]TVX89476.1 flagellar hook-basal body protein [Paenibacillus agilis]
MIRGLYTAASGMITQQRRHDTITNNIANAQTPGFKAVHTSVRSFPEMMIRLMGSDKAAGAQLGQLGTGVFGEESQMLFVQGDLMQTKQMGDFALVSDIEVPGMNFDASGKSIDEQGNVTYKPEVFFTVQQGEEVLYTRDGHFTINEDQELVTADGALVLGANNAPIILVDTPIQDLRVDPQGRMFNARTGADLGERLLLSRVENPNDLIRAGHGSFRLENNQAAVVDPALVRVEQGYLERSNVDTSQSMVDMMSAFRAYEANHKMIQFYDKTLEKTVNEIGRV